MNEPLLLSDDVDANRQMAKNSTPSFQANVFSQQPDFDIDANLVQNQNNIINPPKHEEIPYASKSNPFNEVDQNYHINPNREDINLLANKNFIDKTQKENGFIDANPPENKKGNNSKKNKQPKRKRKKNKSTFKSDAAECCEIFGQVCVCLGYLCMLAEN